MLSILLPSRKLEDEMNKLEDLARASLAKRILDHEEYKSTIGKIFVNVERATQSFQVHPRAFS